MNEDPQVLPDSVWSTYWVLALLGLVVGVLCGAGYLSGIGLMIFMVVAIAAFVIWAVWMIEPRTLADDSAYKGEE